MVGAFTNQILPSLPVFTASDAGRDVYLEDGTRWYCTDTEWVSYVATSGTGGVFDSMVTKLDTIEEGADITDATNVNAAGAVMNSDVSTTPMTFVINESSMVSNLTTKVPTQSSVKSYVDNALATTIAYKGAYNAATNTPDLDVSPTGTSIGDMYVVTVLGTFFSTPVAVGDWLIVENSPAIVESDWTIVQKDLDGPAIKIAYEGEPDTNAFTDLLELKLSNIDAYAQQNVPTNISMTAGTTSGPRVNSNTGADAVIPSASGTASGIITTGIQSFAGNKTFNSGITGTLTGSSTSCTGNSVSATTAGSCTGNSATANKLTTPRTIDITGNITATAVAFDGSSNISISAIVNTAAACTGNSATATTASNCSGTSVYALACQGTFTALAFNATSLRSTKENIHPFIKSALDIVNETDIYSFNYIKDAKKEPKIGFIADDSPVEIAGLNNNMFDINSTVGVLLKAVQELSNEIDTLKGI